MERYIRLVEFLGIVMGPHCEIVLQDLSEDKRSIIAIANGRVSGRNVGSPLTDLALRIVAQGSWKAADYECNYSGLTKDNRVLRSSTYFIKENGKLLGMLCINIDTNVYTQLSNDILKLGGLINEGLNESDLSTDNHIENFLETIADTIARVVRDVFGNENVLVDRLTQDERLLVVEELNKRGLFLLKGAVSEVAEFFSCSEASIYRYLAKINKKNK